MGEKSIESHRSPIIIASLIFFIYKYNSLFRENIRNFFEESLPNYNKSMTQKSIENNLNFRLAKGYERGKKGETEAALAVLNEVEQSINVFLL